jgi:hypothetical protein
MLTSELRYKTIKQIDTSTPDPLFHSEILVIHWCRQALCHMILLMCRPPGTGRKPHTTKLSSVELHTRMKAIRLKRKQTP